MRKILIFVAAIFGMGCSQSTGTQAQSQPLAGRTICIDPGHGGTAATDHFRKGPTGEREEWINLRVALLVRDMLQARGAKVIITRTTDTNISFPSRVEKAVALKADAFVSVHHNASGDKSANFPIVFYFGNASENAESVELGKLIIKHFRKNLYPQGTPAVLVSDHTVYPGGGTFVLRKTQGMPAVIGEAAFYSNPEGERNLKDSTYNNREAEAYVAALEEYFSAPANNAPTKQLVGRLSGFASYRGTVPKPGDVANWLALYRQAMDILPTDTAKAAQLFARSAIAFPDSYHARDCLLKLSEIEQKKDPKLAHELKKRAEEYFVPVGNE